MGAKSEIRRELLGNSTLGNAEEEPREQHKQRLNAKEQQPTGRGYCEKEAPPTRARAQEPNQQHGDEKKYHDNGNKPGAGTAIALNSEATAVNTRPHQPTWVKDDHNGIKRAPRKAPEPPIGDDKDDSDNASDHGAVAGDSVAKLNHLCARQTCDYRHETIANSGPTEDVPNNSAIKNRIATRSFPGRVDLTKERRARRNAGL